MNKTRRKLIMSSGAIVAAGLFGLTKARQNEQAMHSAVLKDVPKPNPRLGINLSGIAYWGSEFPFTDLFKQAGEWAVEGRPETLGLEIDADGWLKRLPEGVSASAIISSLNNRHFPSGDYVILYDGEGEINIPHHVTQSRKPGRLAVHVDGRKGIFSLEITKTNHDNYIKRIRVIPKAYEKTYEKERWNPHFLNRWSGVACLRFMDYMQTNNSKKSNLNSRPKVTDASFAKKGVPVEWLVDLANRLDCDAWFCMPHLASDDYISVFAQYVAKHLNPSLHAWVEYSNEVWNGSFKQHAYAKESGLRLKLAEHDGEAASLFYAHRSVAIFKLWEKEFGGKQRLVRVLAAFATYDKVAEQIVSFKLPDQQLAADYADVLAVANYVGMGVSANSQPTEKEVASWSLSQVFDHLNEKALPEAKRYLVANKKIADAYGLKFVAYEAGQHLVAFGDSPEQKKVTQLFIKANSDVQMGDVYLKSLQAWQHVGGDLTCSYNSVGGWSRWGSWGLMQHYDDPPTPKFKTVMDWAKVHGQTVTF